MLFNVVLINPDQSRELLLISGSSWSNCLSYAEGTGKEILSIQNQNGSEVTIIGTLTENSYILTLKDNVTLSTSYEIVYSTFGDMILWVQSQTDKTLMSMNIQQRQFVTL